MIAAAGWHLYTVCWPTHIKRAIEHREQKTAPGETDTAEDEHCRRGGAWVGPIMGENSVKRTRHLKK